MVQGEGRAVTVPAPGQLHPALHLADILGAQKLRSRFTLRFSGVLGLRLSSHVAFGTSHAGAQPRR